MVDDIEARAQVALAELAPWWRTWWPEADVERLAADVLARLGRSATVWELADLQVYADAAEMNGDRAARWARLRARAEALNTDDAEWAERLDRIARALTA